MARGRRLAALPLAALAICIAAPAAHAGIMSGGQYTANPGEANQVTASYDGTHVTIADSVPITVPPEDLDPEAGGRCSQPSANSVRCALDSITLYLEDGDDSFSFAGPAPARPAPSPGAEGVPLFWVNGGDGDDTLTGSPYGDGLHGSEKQSGAPAVPGGVDRLVGGLGGDDLSDSDGSANFIDGGQGNDSISAYPVGARQGPYGRNTVLAGGGNDSIIGGYGHDRLEGGAGRDRIKGSWGRDRVRGGSGNDNLDGGPERDVTDGGPGNDLVSAIQLGCGGPDTLIGGRGRDRFYVYCGRPTLLMRDRTRDSAMCLSGVTRGRIVADRADRLRGKCRRKR